MGIARRLIIGSAGVIALVAVAVVVARATSRPVDGIPCEMSEAVSYHVHAHLAIVQAGRRGVVYPPAGVGIQLIHLCLYWLHTHDATGVIHIEAGRRISPTLGQFFDIWGQPLSPERIWKWRVAAGALRVFVGEMPYHGNPRNIVLRNHTRVTIELGPPYIQPPYFDFAAYGL